MPSWECHWCAKENASTENTKCWYCPHYMCGECVVKSIETAGVLKTRQNDGGSHGKASQAAKDAEEMVDGSRPLKGK